MAGINLYQGQLLIPRFTEGLSINEKSLTRKCQEAFRHSKLDKDADIRLLTVLPGKPSDPLACIVQHHSLDCVKATYEALSYYWGDPQPICPITLNGGNIKITRNLESALRHLRYRDTPRILWIDAICIDQANHEEKGEQVRHMHHVYGHATRVIAWLGPVADDVQLAYSELKAIVADAPSPGVLDWDVTKRKEVIQITQQPKLWDIIGSLVDRPYWTRAWIVQELAYAKDIEVVAGYKSLEWSIWINGLAAIHNSRDDPYQNIPGMEKLSDVLRLGWKISHMQDADNDFTMLQHVHDNLPCKLSNERDRVYAVLNLRSQENKGNFRIDYGLTIEEVYEDFAAWSIVSSRTFDVLSYGVSAQSIKEETLGTKIRYSTAGSWVPTWNYVAGIPGAYLTSPLVHRTDRKNPIYHASRDSRITMQPLMWKSYPSFKHTLTTQGYRVDRVKRVGSLFGANEIENVKNPDLPIFKEWEAIMNELDAIDNQYTCADFDASDIRYLARIGGLPTAADRGKYGANRTHCEVQTGQEQLPTSAENVEDRADPDSRSFDEVPAWFKHLDDSGATCQSAVFVEDFKLPELPLRRLALIEAYWRTLIADRVPHSWSSDWRQKTFDRMTQPGRAGRNVWRLYTNWREGVHVGDKWTFLDPWQDMAYPSLVTGASFGRRFMITERGFMGLAPAPASVGDVICLAEGSQTPLVLAKVGHYEFNDPDTPNLVDWHFVGDCYLHGIMDGEAWRDTEEEKPEVFLIR